MKLWRKGYRKLFGSLSIAFTVLFFILLNRLNKFDPNRRVENLINAVTAWLLAEAGIAAAWTARETFDQKQVAQKQLGYSLRPYLRIQLNESSRPIFDIVNDGNGVAIDVRFEKTEFRDDETDRLVSFKIKNRPLISTHGFTTVSPREILGGLPVGAPRQQYDYLKSKIHLHFKIVATYKNLKKDVFKVVFVSDETYNDSFRIESQEIIKKG